MTGLESATRCRVREAWDWIPGSSGHNVDVSRLRHETNGNSIRQPRHFAQKIAERGPQAQASKIHMKALQFLKYSLTNAVITRSNGIGSAVHGLGVCKMSEELSHSPNASSTMPTPFALLLEARGLASLHHDQPLTRDLVFKAVHLNLMLALSSRVAFAFGRKHRLHSASGGEV